EDKGYYVSHNLPPHLIPDVFKAGRDNNPPVEPMAVVTDTRSRVFPGSVEETVAALRAIEAKPTLLFLDVRDAVLIALFDSLRRTLQLHKGGFGRMGISRDDDTLSDVRVLQHLNIYSMY